MHPDLKLFYQCAIDTSLYEDIKYAHKYASAYKLMLDTHPHCEDLLDEYAELACRIYSGESNLPLAARMSEIEKTLDSCRLPF